MPYLQVADTNLCQEPVVQSTSAILFRHGWENAIEGMKAVRTL